MDVDTLFHLPGGKWDSVLRPITVNQVCQGMMSGHRHDAVPRVEKASSGVRTRAEVRVRREGGEPTPSVSVGNMVWLILLGPALILLDFP